jgi:hypothetical protein
VPTTEKPEHPKPAFLTIHLLSRNVGLRIENAEPGEVVRSPGFEPGSSAWEADVLARLDYDRIDSEILSYYY